MFCWSLLCGGVDFFFRSMTCCFRHCHHSNHGSVRAAYVRSTENTIDVWWVSEDGGLLLLIPYLLTLHPVWRFVCTTIFQFPKIPCRNRSVYCFPNPLPLKSIPLLYAPHPMTTVCCFFTLYFTLKMLSFETLRCDNEP